MTERLEAIFAELGVSQYLDAFIDQGFDTWDTILDITESDLDALGVKLGHRRKLQRQIANTRSFSPFNSALLLQPTRDEVLVDVPGRTEPPNAADSRGETAPPAVTKRKYRRHPKRDVNAPERPPSAYVLFSNKMREDLQGRNLTFTEIAKLVGENWQNISAVDREPYETAAQMAKDNYNKSLAAYKKTAEFRKYNAYLQDFKAKHANQSQDKEASKRLRLSEVAGRTGSTSSPNRTSRSGSGSGSQRGSEPPSNHPQRQGSLSHASATNSQYATMALSGNHTSIDQTMTSPKPFQDEIIAPVESLISPIFQGGLQDVVSRQRRYSHRADGHRAEPSAMPLHLPPFSDVFESREHSNGRSPAVECSVHSLTRSYLSESPGPVPGLWGGHAVPPSLRKDSSTDGMTSSSGTTSSSESSSGYPRTPVEGSLPIHTLLADPPSLHDAGQHAPLVPGGRVPLPYAPSLPHLSASIIHGPNHPGNILSPSTHKLSSPTLNSHDDGGFSGGQSPPPNMDGITYAPSMQPSREPRLQAQSTNLDGMTALLKAGEIVDGRTG